MDVDMVMESKDSASTRPLLEGPKPMNEHEPQPGAGPSRRSRPQLRSPAHGQPQRQRTKGKAKCKVPVSTAAETTSSGKPSSPAPKYRRANYIVDSDTTTSSSSSSDEGNSEDHYQDDFTMDMTKPTRLAHDLLDSKKRRSSDIGIVGELTQDFASLKVSPKILEGLKSCGFNKPSPIQLRGVPLGRLGQDMILQAKSGTGKTVVFSIIALEKVDVKNPKIQVLVVSPTREITFQSTRVIREIGAKIEGLNIRAFIGGIPIEKDIERMEDCHIVVGTPGRLVHLLSEYNMDISELKVFVQDEVDKLLDRAFFDDLQYVYGKLPKEGCQVIVSSATYPKGIDDLIAWSMKDPLRVQLDRHEPVLEAIEQYAVDIRGVYLPEKKEFIRDEDIYQLKKRAIKELITLPCFNQIIIFVNHQARAERIFCDLLDERIDVCYLGSFMSQKDRLKAFTTFHEQNVRILVATDLASRGLDFENVDLVINYEIPIELETHIHRMGRAGRFGTFGTNIVLWGFDSEKLALEEFQTKLPTLKIYHIEDHEAFLKIGAMESEKKSLKVLATNQRDEEEMAKMLEAEKHLPSYAEIWDAMENGQISPAEYHLKFYPMVNPDLPHKTLEQTTKEMFEFVEREEKERIDRREARLQKRRQRKRIAEASKVSKPEGAESGDE